MEEFKSVAEPARFEVESLIRQLGLIDEVDREDDAHPEVEPETAANADANDVSTDKEDLSEEKNKHVVTWVTGLPTRS
jgi:hypothetical protein